MNARTPHNVVPDYIAHGWQLCAIPPGEKGPTGIGWNTAGVKPEDGQNVGLLHALSGTAAFDIDDLTLTATYLGKEALETLLQAADAVQIVSGREGRAKLLYRMPLGMPLPTKKVMVDGKTAFELRCASVEGKSMQDVLPPSIHPSGSTYQWGGKGNWKQLPEVPASLMAVWLNLLAKDGERNIPTGDKTPASMDEVRSAVMAISPDCSRQVWIECGMGLEVLGELTGDPAACFELFDTWSAGSEQGKYSAKVTAQQWRSFKPRPNGIGIGTLFHHAQQWGWKRPVPDVSELFQPVKPVSRKEEQPMPELKPNVEIDAAVRKQMNDCISMQSTLLHMGYAFPNAAGEWIRYKVGKATQQGDYWTIDGIEGIDAAAAFVAIGFAGDTAAAEATWREWAKDSRQMAYFYGHRDTSGAYGVQSMLSWQTRNDTPPQLHPLLRFVEGYANEGTNFVIDGVIAEGPVVLAATHGVGKSTATVALACRVAHLCEENDPLRPTVRRNVIYLTEDPKQIQRILYAMNCENQFGLHGDTFEERLQEAFDRIRIVPTVRMEAAEIVKVAEEYAKGWSIPNERNGVRYDAPPWVIFDTTSASIDLDEENSNSEIGKAVALLKSEFYLKREIPFLLVSHTAKSLRHAEPSSMSTRGGVAWEADVYQVLYMSTGDSGERFLEIGIPNAKKRFSPRFYSIGANGHSRECVVTNRFKELSTERIMWASLKPMTEEEVTGKKEAAKDKAEETAEEKAIRKLEKKILDFFEDNNDFTGSKNDLVKRLTGKREYLIRAIDSLIKDGRLKLMDAEGDGDGKKVVCFVKHPEGDAA